MRRTILALWCGLSFIAPASAQQIPIVRAEIIPKVVSVGERVELRITVLAPTWFPKPPEYPSFELPNAMTREPPDSSYPISERIGAETWSGILRSYEIYPLIGATYRLEDETVTVTWANPGTSTPFSRKIGLPAIEFEAIVPSGAEGLDPYLAGHSLTITREIEGEIETLSVGDAIVVHYTAELTGLPAVFLPPMFSDTRVNGAAVYANAPVVEDGKPARRVETLTFVVESSGEFTLPGVELEWWNTVTNTIETASVPPLSVPVSGTLFSLVQPSSATGTALGWLLVVGLSVGGVVAWRWLPSLRARWLAVKETRRRSEPYAFGELRRSLRHGDARAIHRAMLTWLDRLVPGLDARSFANEHGDSALKAGVEDMIASQYAGSNVSFAGANLDPAFTAARRDLLGRRAETSRTDLPPMNP